MKKTNRRNVLKDITIIASLIALSVVLSLFDRFISNAILSAIPFLALMAPNFKLGIANVVILIILYNYGFKFGLLAVTLKVGILALFNPSGLPMSFGGSFLSFFIMYLLVIFLKNRKFLFFVSMVGGFTHSFGQIIFGFLYYGLIDINKNILDINVLIYSPVMLLMGLLTGLLMGFVAKAVDKFLNEQHIIIHKKEEEKMNKNIIYVAHRGSKIHGGVENTEHAFLGGIKAKAKGAECDVRVTKDGVYIICHDSNLERLTKESFYQTIIDVNEANYEEIKDIELTQTYKNQTYHGHICLFTKYLELCRDNNIIPIIELKWTNGIYSDNKDENNFNYSNLDKIVAYLKEYNLFETAYVMTSMHGCLAYLREKYSTLKLQWLCWENNPELVDWCINKNINIDIEYTHCDKALVDKCHQNNLIINVWTLNDENELEKYIEMGVDMITSDWIIKE